MKRTNYRVAKINALQAAADILADAATDPDTFEIDELSPPDLRAAMFELDRLALRLQKEAMRLEVLPSCLT